MKRKFVTLLIFTIVTFSYSQNNTQSTILNKFIAANNSGTEESISQFIKESYEPSLYKKIDLEQHIAFYNMISKDFGRLKSKVYEMIEEKPLKLVVLLIKEEESLLNKNIDPSEVLMVEFDFSEKNPKFLNRALGLGALVCELKKE